MTLTTLEQTVLDALKQNAGDCSGGDFAITEEVNYRLLKLTAQEFGGVVTSLQNKGVIAVDVTYVTATGVWAQRYTRLGRTTGGTKVTQVTFLEAAYFTAFIDKSVMLDAAKMLAKAARILRSLARDQDLTLRTEYQYKQLRDAKANIDAALVRL